MIGAVLRRRVLPWTVWLAAMSVAGWLWYGINIGTSRGYVEGVVGELDPPEGTAKFTGGSIRPDGSGILLRTKSRLFHFEMALERTVAQALAGEPCQLEIADEVQGEAVAWLADGRGIFTVGEGSHAALNVARCGEP